MIPEIPGVISPFNLPSVTAIIAILGTDYPYPHIGRTASIFLLFLSKLANSSKFLSPLQADGELRNFAPSGTDFAKTWNPRSKLRGIPTKINQAETQVYYPFLLVSISINLIKH